MTIKISYGSGGSNGAISFKYDDSPILTANPTPWTTSWGAWGGSNYAADFTFPDSAMGVPLYEIRRNTNTAAGLAGVQTIVLNGAPVVGKDGKVSWDWDQFTFLTFRRTYLWNNTQLFPGAGGPGLPAYSAVWVELYNNKIGKLRYAPPAVDVQQLLATHGVTLPTGSISTKYLLQGMHPTAANPNNGLQEAPLPLPGPTCACNYDGIFYGRHTNFSNPAGQGLPSTNTHSITLEFALSSNGSWNIVDIKLQSPGIQPYSLYPEAKQNR